MIYHAYINHFKCCETFESFMQIVSSNLLVNNNYFASRRNSLLPSNSFDFDG